MTSHGSWKTTSFGADTPQLLVKTRFDDLGYHIQLTDLSRIWGERLSRDDVIKRAVDSGCSINPGDGDQNYNAFLKYIEQALNKGEETTATLHTSASENLRLELSASLPGSIPDLEWTVELVRLKDTALASEVVNPLLLQANSLRGQIQELLDEISAKDHVIEKITDKFKASGNDLATVFPGVSNVKARRNKSQSDRSQFASYVKGLGLFNEDTWRASNQKLSEAQTLTPDVMDTALRDLPSVSLGGGAVYDWVEKLRTTSDGDLEDPQVNSGTKSTSVVRKAELRTELSTDDHGFQRQETPPRASKHTATAKSATADDDHDMAVPPATNGEDSETETEDDDCLDIAPTTSQQQARNTIEPPDEPMEEHNLRVATSRQTPVKRGGLGTFGGKKVKSPQPEHTGAPSSSPRHPVSKAKVKNEQHDTESEPEPEPEPKTSPRKARPDELGATAARNAPDDTESEAEPQPKSATSKPKLGRFGGKKEQPKASTPDVPSSAPRPKLGMFGGKAKVVSPKDGHDTVKLEESSVEPRRLASHTPSRRSEPEVEQEPHRELTDEEKKALADEKREKLKRELEAKAKGPVKKKRKF